MTAREVVCACEDVTTRDMQDAVARGFTDIESIKRYTGLGTGICQGKACLGTAAAFLSSQANGACRPTTARQPAYPLSLAALAALEEPAVYPGPESPSLFAPRVLRSPPKNLPRLPRAAQIVVIGAGVMGLALAYHLSQFGVRDVVVLERDYLGYGASGRNGGGTRLQWATPMSIEIMKEAMGRTRGLAHELGINIWLRQGGYLFLARRPEDMEKATANVAMQRQHGVHTQLLSPAACRKKVPHLRVDDVLGGTFNPTDGVIFPWPFMFGYAQQAQKRGVHIATFTHVTGIEVQNGRVAGVVTNRGRIATDLVVNAAAAWSPEVSLMAGIKARNHPVRHEILVTESLKPCLNPLVTEMDSGLYFSQSLRGELVGGMGDPQEPPGLQMRASLRFAVRMAKAMVRRWPLLGQVQLVRQWAGCYDVSPDGNPIVGEDPACGGFFQLNGFVGHGFMMAPSIGLQVAKLLTGRGRHPCFDLYTPRRFLPGAPPVPQETLIIG